MGFRKNENCQIDLLEDYFLQMSERTKRIIETSWAKPFYSLVFSNINESRFEVLYSDNKASRPNTPVNIIVGALILKEMFTLTDDELLESIICDVRYQYALGTTSFKEQPLSDRSFSRFRERLVNYYDQTGIDLVKEEMESLAGSFCSFFNVSPTITRMDSLLVASNCRRFSRYALFFKCVANLATTIHRLGGDELLVGKEHYLSRDYFNKTIAYMRHEDIKDNWNTVINDGIDLLENTAEILAENQDYQNLQRLFEEHLEKVEDSFKLININRVPSDSLQNPSDPDACFRKKNGKSYIGYTGNVEETVSEGIAFITGYDLEKNIMSDLAFMYKYIETWNSEVPGTLITDGAYGSADTFEKAKNKNITLYTTALMAKNPGEWEADFVFSEETHELLRCPQGQKPLKSKYYDYLQQTRATFLREFCESCPLRDQCISKMQKKTAVVVKSEKTVFRAQQVKAMRTQKYRNIGNIRNGVEGIPSVLRRRYKVDSMPTRGLARSKIFFGFKIGAINGKRAIKQFIERAISSSLITKIKLLKEKVVFP